jgi:hypothetical protein
VAGARTAAISAKKPSAGRLSSRVALCGLRFGCRGIYRGFIHGRIRECDGSAPATPRMLDCDEREG